MFTSYDLTEALVAERQSRLHEDAQRHRSRRRRTGRWSQPPSHPEPTAA